MDVGQVIARYTLAKEPPPWDTMWTDVREAKPRCRVRPNSDTAVVAVIQQGGSEPELHVLTGDVEIDQYEDEKYKAIRDEGAR